jgi:peptidoglycan/LPS O-acetylase OafA/YrhL
MTLTVRASEPQHFAFLDALRGLAALAVVVVHTVQNFNAGSLTPLLGLGAAGVQLFYIVSAYSLCLSFNQRRSSEPHAMRSYLVRRLFRIAPLFWVAMVLYLLRPLYLADSATPVDVHPPTWDLMPWHVLSTFFFVNGWHYQSINFIVPGGWSVAVESNFYLLLPFLMAYAVTTRRALVLVGLTLLFAVVARFALYRVAGTTAAMHAGEAFGIFAGLWLPAQLPVFALGILMFHCVPRSSLATQVAVSARLWQPLAFGALALALIGLAPDSWSRYIPSGFQAGLFLLAFSWLMAWWPHALVVNRVTQFLGKISYSLYLLHFLALHLVLWASQIWFEPLLGGVPTFWQALPWVLASATLLAWLGYHCVEVPGQTLGRWLLKKTAAAPTRPTALARG